MPCFIWPRGQQQKKKKWNSPYVLGPSLFKRRFGDFRMFMCRCDTDRRRCWLVKSLHGRGAGIPCVHACTCVQVCGATVTTGPRVCVCVSPSCSFITRGKIQMFEMASSMSAAILALPVELGSTPGVGCHHTRGKWYDRKGAAITKKKKKNDSSKWHESWQCVFSSSMHTSQAPDAN